MGAKKTYVALSPKSGGATQDFEIEHAARIMRLANCAWVCVDKRLEWTKDGFRNRKNTSRVEKSVKADTD